MSDQDVYFQKLGEIVGDGDEIVTISSFANTQNISVQNSLEILSNYLETRKKAKLNSLASTYILIGKLTKGIGTVVYLLKDSTIESKMLDFQEINSKVLYSIQNSKNVDLRMLNLVDWPNLTRVQEKFKPLFGTVRTKNATRRILKFKSLLPSPTPTVINKTFFFQPKIKLEVNSEVNTMDTKGKCPLKLEAVPENKMNENKIRKDKSSLSTFLTKIKSETSTNGTNRQRQNHTKNTNSKLTEHGGEPIKENISTALKFTERETKSTQKSKDSADLDNSENKLRNSKSMCGESAKNNSKKRKRIIETSHSESDDNNEEIRILSDDEKGSQSPVYVESLASKNKKRVAVDRSYVDEEGFVVTRKEYIYEPGSEDESKTQENLDGKQHGRIETKRNNTSESTASPKKNGNGKKVKKIALQNQTTLMNFFMKK